MLGPLDFMVVSSRRAVCELFVRLHIEKVRHESIGGFVRVFVAHPTIHEWTRNVALPRMGIVRVFPHRPRQVAVGSRRFPASEVSEPNAETNKAVEPTAIRLLVDYFQCFHSHSHNFFAPMLATALCGFPHSGHLSGK